MQVESATDVLFARQAAFQPLYGAVIHPASHVAKPDNAARFWRESSPVITRRSW